MRKMLCKSVAIAASPLILALGLTFTQAQPLYAQAPASPNSEALAKELAAIETSNAANAARIAEIKAALAAGTAIPAAAEAAPAAPPAPTGTSVAPFSDWDWTWLNGNPRNKDVAFDSSFFTPEIRADLTYTYDFNKPIDNSMGGSSELFRHNEIQLEQLGLGGNFHHDGVEARFMTQFGAYSQATIRNDPSPAKGQWNLNDANRYLAEAYGGYNFAPGSHKWVRNGFNIDAGIFMSYVGLFSYYNFDNWAYQPSYVSSNTPWFFQGIRVQYFPTAHFKIEPWFINGWQSYGSSNNRKGVGGQLKWTPRPWVNVISNNYGLGHDDLYTPNRGRIHTDNSVEFKYYDNPKKFWDKSAISITGDIGCEFGPSTTTKQGVYVQGVSCLGNTKDKNSVGSSVSDPKNGIIPFNAGVNPKQSFIGFMVYDRNWFAHDKYGVTIGFGQINNPGRYLVLVPPINGETAASAALNSPYFSFNPGTTFKPWDSSFTFDYMPKQWLTFRVEYDYRHSNVPYWAGKGGMTPPTASGFQPGTNNGNPTSFTCNDGSPDPTGACGGGPIASGGHGGLWKPDLRRDEQLIDIDWMIKF